MRGKAWLVAGGITIAFWGMIVGCKSAPALTSNGDNALTGDDDDAGGGGKANASATTPPAASSSAAPAGSVKPIPASDAGRPDAAASSPAVSNAGKVTCGATTCDVGEGQSCCGTDTGPTSGTCGDNGGCPDFEAQCDEAADCGDGEVCCFGYGAWFCADTGTCSDPDFGQNVRICKTDAECEGDPNGTTCAPRTCSLPDDNDGTVKVPVRMCGKTAECQ
jgi:hypothetical protein